MTSPAPTPVRARLASPQLRHLIERVVRPRLPDSAVEDVVQTVLCDAVAAKQLPAEDEHLRRWLVGIARHKVADFHRARARDKHTDCSTLVAAAPCEHSAREWAQWANKQVEDDSEAKRTLGWMAREGGGEKLAHIAASEQLPAPQVRQRVSRLRRRMRKRWAAELGALAAVALIALVALGVWYQRRNQPPIAVPRLLPDLLPAGDELTPEQERAKAQRNVAMHMCAQSSCHDDWQQCLDLLDEAAAADPAGDEAPAIQQMRARAKAALQAPDTPRTAQPPPPFPTGTTAPPPTPLSPPPSPIMHSPTMHNPTMRSPTLHKPTTPRSTARPPAPPMGTAPPRGTPGTTGP